MPSPIEATFAAAIRTMTRSPMAQASIRLVQDAGVEFVVPGILSLGPNAENEKQGVTGVLEMSVTDFEGFSDGRRRPQNEDEVIADNVVYEISAPPTVEENIKLVTCLLRFRRIIQP